MSTEQAGAPVVDVHAHVAPAALLGELARPGGVHGVRFGPEERGRGRIQTATHTGAVCHPGLCDSAERIRFLDAAGIDRQLISPWIDLLVYDLDPAYATGFHELVNAHIAAEVAQYPTRLVGLGTVPLQLGGEAAAAVLRRAVTEHGLAGVEIGTHIPGAGLADPDLAPFFTTAEELGAVVFLHPNRADELRPGLLPELEFAAANPADTTLAIAQLMFTGRLAEHPELKLITSHGGGFLPYQIGRLEQTWRLSGRAGPGPADLVRRLHFDSIVHEPAALRFLVATLGADRVLLGTDHPFALGDLDPRASLAVLEPGESDQILTGAGALLP